MRVLHAERRVRPALGAREAERRLGRLPGTLGRREIGPARERLAHQLLGARGRRRERELAHRLDVRRVHADQREQSGHRLAAVAFRVRHLALEAALLEGDLVELGARDVTLARARLAHAHRLPVVLEVLARQAETLRRFEERHEARAQLEGEPALEIRALGRRRLLAAARRRHPRTPLARKQDLLLEPDLGHDRVTHADAARVRLPEREVAGSRRERRVRQEAGRDHIAVGRTHVQRAGEQLGVLPAQPGQRLVERQAHRVLPAGRRAEGQHEREHEPAPPHRAPPRLPGARVTRPPPRGAPGRAV